MSMPFASWKRACVSISGRGPDKFNDRSERKTMAKSNSSFSRSSYSAGVLRFR